jgi:hypothetical protein
VSTLDMSYIMYLPVTMALIRAELV